MHRLTADQAVMAPENGIQIGRWTQYAGLPDMPFGAMWFTIPAGGRSRLDVHPETELAVVVSGEATFCAGDEELTAPAGTAVVLRPQEEHVVRAGPAGDVKVLSLYWMP
jgi:quercetin dioxygenase-like cupin family protein